MQASSLRLSGPAVPAAALLTILLVFVVALISGQSAGTDHALKARFDAALDVAPGQFVTLAGSQVGTIDQVSRDRHGALVTFHIDDPRAWPLSKNTTARLDWSSTTSYTGISLQLLPGKGAPFLSDDATIAATRTVTPVDFDQVYGILDAATRPQLRALFANLARTFDGHQRDLQSALANTPSALNALDDLTRQLGTDQTALSTLVASASSVSRSLAGEDPQLESIVTYAAGTFDALASDATSIQASLNRLPSTLKNARGGLARLRQSIPSLQALLTKLQPGAYQLDRLAPVLSQTTVRVRSVTPIATSGLATASAAAPQITRLLREFAPFATHTSRALAALAPIVGCLRPYGPEIAALPTTWDGFFASYDSLGHHVLANPAQQPISAGTAMNPSQLVSTFPQLQYAPARPPGLNAGQPWFQPQCGVGSAARKQSSSGGNRR